MRSLLQASGSAGEARRLQRCLRDASDQIRRDLDSDRVVEIAVDAVHDALRPSRTSIWLTSGGEAPRVAHTRGKGASAAGAAEVPGAVVDCVKRERTVWHPLLKTLAVPIRAPKSGMLGALLVEGTGENGDQHIFVEAVAHEAGFALEAAGLFESAIAEKEKTEAILARIGDAVLVTDVGGSVRQCNQAAERLLGAQRDQVIGRHCEAALGLHVGERPLDCSAGCALLALRDPEDGTLGCEAWRRQEDGRRQPLLASVEVVRDADGRVSEIVHSLRDVTRLKQADEAKTMFLATASHELKTPLTVIQGFARALMSETPLDEGNRQRALEAMETRAIELNQIVERILLSSRIEAGRAQVSPRELDLLPILRRRAEDVWAATGRQVRTELPAELPAAIADPNAVTTVVDHLLDNAVKYSPGGEAVELRVSADDRRVMFSVADRGIGMDSEQAAHCFEKFWQAESSDVRRFGGTGIGLYIVKSLIEAMGGEVRADSAHGQGTTFNVSLPRAGAAAEAMPPTSRAPQPGVGEPSIVREFMRQMGIPERRGP